MVEVKEGTVLNLWHLYVAFASFYSNKPIPHTIAEATAMYLRGELPHNVYKAYVLSNPE